MAMFTAKLSELMPVDSKEAESEAWLYSMMDWTVSPGFIRPRMLSGERT